MPRLLRSDHAACVGSPRAQARCAHTAFVRVLLAASLLLASACRPPRASAAIRLRATVADSAARAAIAREREIDAASFPAGTVAVVPLSVAAADSEYTDLAYGLADLLITDLAQSDRVRIVDRVRTDAILRELEFSRSGLVDSASGVRIGRLVGARALVAGALARDGVRALRIDARVADAQRGTIEATLSATTPIDRILDGEKTLAFRVFDLLGVILTPAEREAVAQVPTRSLSALLAYSRGVRAEANRDFDAAAAEYARALRADPSFMSAHVNLNVVRGRKTTSTSPGLRRAVSLAVDNVVPGQATLERSAADATLTTAVPPVTITIPLRVP